VLFVLITIALGILNIFVGIGLWIRKKWARKTAIILSLFLIIFIISSIIKNTIIYYSDTMNRMWLPLYYLYLIFMIIILIVSITIFFYLSFNKKVKSYFK